MDNLSAFVNGYLNRNKELMVFDWATAARLIHESGCEIAHAGLRDDWEYTGGTIFFDGKPYYDSYTYLASTWAVPELEINGERIPCYIMQSEKPEWNENTLWPEEVLKFLEE